MFNAPLPKIRDTARLLYKGYVTSMFVKYGAFYLSSKLDSKKIESYLADIVALNKKYGVYYDTIDYDLSPTSMDKHIKKMAVANYKAIFSEIMEEKVPTKKSPKAKSSKAKAKTLSITIPSAPRSKVSVKKAKTSSKEGKSVPPKAKVKKGKAKTVSKAKAKKTKGCDDYTLSELRNMAKVLRIAGSSRMNKRELCGTLDI